MTKQELTKQSKCEYCHYPFKEIVNHDDYDEIESSWYEAVKIYLSDDGLCYEAEYNQDDVSGGLDGHTGIDYCPMCGRRLNDEKWKC